MPFEKVDPQADFPRLEREMLALWDRIGAFEKLKQKNAGKPFFAWMNFTRMHAFTHVRASMQGQSGMPGNEYADGMIEHDGDVGPQLAENRSNNTFRLFEHRDEQVLRLNLLVLISFS